MKIELWSVGKPHENYVRPGIEDFTGRLEHYFPAEWNIISPPKNAASLKEAALKEAEGKLLLAQIHKEDYLVLLDETGTQLSSPQLADFLQQRASDRAKRIVFLIGGAFGVSDAVFKRANIIWGLSKLVFPHMLVRLILSEQLYRACTILRHEKYHHV